MEVIYEKKKGEFMRKNHGFTLAEVLITLGIIGVVAAMTLPTLIANTNSAKFKSQFKKTLSTLNQAGLMAQAQYDTDYGLATEACGKTPGSDKPESNGSICAILNGTLTGFTANNKGALKDKNNVAYALKKTYALDSTAASNFVIYQLNDGSMIGFDPDVKAANKECTLEVGKALDTTWVNNHPGCIGFIDTNGPTLPNKEVSCSSTPGSTKDYTYDSTKAKTLATPCLVKQDSTYMTDVYPIAFHDATVEPASAAAKAVLQSSK